MINDQVQEVLDLLNSQLHDRVDYALFSRVFDAVANINVPEGYKLVPVEPTPKMIDSTWNHQEDIEGMSHNTRNEFIYKAMIGVSE